MSSGRATSRARSGAGRLALFACAAIAVSGAGGCAANRADEAFAQRIERGEYGRARGYLYNKGLARNLGDKRYLLDRERLLLVLLADGLPEHAESAANDTYEVLRIQGLNADKTVPSVVFHEGVRIWKGEPFEQAMAYAAIAIQKGSIGDWGNMRAAAESSLFLLRDFGENEGGERLSTLEIARRAAAMEGEAGDEYLESGYIAARTNFTLGYVLVGIASYALGRTQEASDYFTEAVRLRPDIRPAIEAIAGGRANTVLIVDAGRGPEKVAYGPDNALSRFVVRTRSDTRTLAVSGDALGGRSVAQASDVNEMARDHMWNNMEEVRTAKSNLGSALLMGGIIAAAAIDDDSGTAQIIGLSAAGLGALMKGTASADLRHLEALPQRTYVVPLDVSEGGTSVRLQIDGLPQTSFVVAGLTPPPPGQIQVRYLRLPTVPMPLGWATSGAIRYANDAWDGPVPGDELPYILGGRCVRVPTHETLASYQSRGNLLGMTLADLLELYRLEGIVTDPTDELEKVGVHVLEGGNSLACPQPGTAGYARLFGQDHGPYEPRSKEVRQFVEKLRARQATSVPGGS